MTNPGRLTMPSGPSRASMMLEKADIDAPNERFFEEARVDRYERKFWCYVQVCDLERNGDLAPDGPPTYPAD